MEYWIAIKPIKASETLDLINATSFPSAKKESRKKLITNLKNIIRHTVKRRSTGVKSISEIEESLRQQIQKGLNGG